MTKHLDYLAETVRWAIKGDPMANQLMNQAEFRQALLSRLSQGSTLPGSGDDETSFMHLIVTASVEEGKDASGKLKAWLAGASDVKICDPYVFNSGPSSGLFSSDDDYIEYLVDLIPSSASKVWLFGDRSNQNTSIKNKIQTALRTRRATGCLVRTFATANIHDRYIIRDGKAGKMIGASFNGFGRKIFTMLDLPAEDVAQIKRILHEIPKI